jgi:hypothetical protein
MREKEAERRSWPRMGRRWKASRRRGQERRDSSGVRGEGRQSPGRKFKQRTL